jgi:hypothetical protein
MTAYLLPIPLPIPCLTHCLTIPLIPPVRSTARTHAKQRSAVLLTRGTLTNPTNRRAAAPRTTEGEAQ